jgi:hypothetical protein
VDVNEQRHIAQLCEAIISAADKGLTFDQRRYTLAMIAVGYATGLVSRMRSDIGPEAAARYDADWDWLMERVTRVMVLNDEA